MREMNNKKQAKKQTKQNKTKRPKRPKGSKGQKSQKDQKAKRPKKAKKAKRAKKGQSYKMDVQRQASQFELYKTKELFLDDKLKVVYRNMDNITLCLVTTNDVDLQETGAFLEKFLGCI